MDSATLRFHGRLRDLVRGGGASDRMAVRTVGTGRSAKDAIESAGVPHTEVDLILVSGPAPETSPEPVGLARVLAAGECIDVFGLDRPPELAGCPGLPGLLPAPPAPVRFVLDGHLGTLARYLRMLGFDAVYRRDAGDDELAQVSAGEGRVLLSRDRGLLKRSIVRFGYLVRNDDPRAQLVDVADRFGLRALARPFSRCVRCNGEIVPVPRADVIEELAGQPRTLRYFDSFGRCTGCRAIYWEGSHYDRMSRLLSEVLSGPGPADGTPDAIE